MTDEEKILAEASDVMEGSIIELTVHEAMGYYLEMFPFVHSYFRVCAMRVKEPDFDEFIAGCPPDMVEKPGSTREFGVECLRTIWDAYTAALDVARREVVERS